MGDYSCIYCEDHGDCYRCSWFFQPDKVHSKCGRRWKEHEVHSQEFYAPWTTCPNGLTKIDN